MYGPLTPCGDCGGACTSEMFCAASDPTPRCEDCRAALVEVVEQGDGDGWLGWVCPRCMTSPAESGCADYDFGPPRDVGADVGF